LKSVVLRISAFLGDPNLVAFLHDWVPLLLMFALVYVVWRTTKALPRTAPNRIQPDSAPPIAWRDIAGVEEAKDELREVVDYLRSPKAFRRVGARVPTGILLYGPPGTGKTLLAKAVAHESGAVFFSQSASAFVEMFAGLGASRIRRLFATARRHAPSIVFIDEIDAVGSRRGADHTKEYDQTLNQLLVEMDGFASQGDVVVIAASNMLEQLDPALLRPGRFDRQIFVSPPDLEGRERILRVHTRNKPVAPEIDYELLARQTSGLTGADLANICNEAAISAVREGRDTIEMTDFDRSLERVLGGMQSRRRMTEHERRVVAYHESGHALLAELLPSVDRVHRISIIPRGQALGYTLNLPEEDRYLKTRDELIDIMTMLLGGRAAEQLVFGSVTNGAADDLRRVAETARAMVDEYAMGTGMGALRMVENGPSEATRRIRDREVQDLTDEAFRAALELIGEHRAELDALAATLLHREVMERSDLDRILGDVPRARPDRRAGTPLGLAAATPVAAEPPAGRRTAPPGPPAPRP
jgi:cell division protease FtsH